MKNYIVKAIRRKSEEGSEFCRMLVENPKHMEVMAELCSEKSEMLLTDPVELLLQASFSEFVDALEETGDKEDEKQMIDGLELNEEEMAAMGMQ